MQEAFQAILQTNEDAKVGYLGNLAFDDLARLVSSGNITGPGIVVHLFQPECDTAPIDIDCQEDLDRWT